MKIFGVRNDEVRTNGWKTFRLSNTDSAYSTMEQMNDGNIAFFYEETHQKGGYDMVFCSLPLDKITNGEYAAGKVKK